jgi:hypothetical protein
MFWVCFGVLMFFVSFLVDWLAGTRGEAPLSKSVKSLASRTHAPKPKLHASLLPLTKV